MQAAPGQLYFLIEYRSWKSGSQCTLKNLSLLAPSLKITVNKIIHYENKKLDVFIDSFGFFIFSQRSV
jgi:hypothetical protein